MKSKSKKFKKYPNVPKLLSFNKTTWTPVIIFFFFLDFANGAYQLFCFFLAVKYNSLDPKGEKIDLSLLLIPIFCFLLTNWMLVLYATSSNGLQKLGLMITTYNWLKFCIDSCCFSILFLRHPRQPLLPIFDVLQISHISGLFRFLLVFVFLHYGARYEAYHRVMVEGRLRVRFGSK